MNKLYMMIGIPGSGKTTLARKLAQELNILIASSDELRKRKPALAEENVFPELYKDIAIILSKGESVIFDATSIDIKTRKSHLQGIKNHFKQFSVIAYYVYCDLDIAEVRVKNRNKLKEELFLPLDVVKMYYYLLEEPSLDEGFAEIIKINNS